jgi:hypothetical protein
MRACGVFVLKLLSSLSYQKKKNERTPHDSQSAFLNCTQIPASRERKRVNSFKRRRQTMQRVFVSFQTTHVPPPCLGNNTCAKEEKVFDAIFLFSDAVLAFLGRRG